MSYGVYVDQLSYLLFLEMVFAARHDRAIEFWEKIRSVSKQRQLDF